MSGDTLQDNLQQQLAAAIKARKLLEDTYEHQFKMLAQFVSRLSLACKGIDLDLDNRLARLRQELSKGTDLEKLVPFIEQTSESLRNLESRQLQESKYFQHELSEKGKQLQKHKGLSDQLRRDLRQLLQDIEQLPASAHGYLSYLTRLISLYQQAWQETTTTESDETEQMHNHLFRRINHELTALLDQLIDTGFATADIELIKAMLQQDESAESLLTACLQTISTIINNIGTERRSAEHFLLNLNQALSDVQHALLNSIQHHQEQQNNAGALQLKIVQHLSNLSSGTEHASSLEQLKQLVSTKLQAITDSLQEKEQLEQLQRSQLLHSLNNMEQRLNLLEQEASLFQSRIAEQRMRSLQDALTEIPNRAAFDERYQLEISRWQRYRKPLCVVLADVDHFKRVNDSYGHSAGDKTLKAIAKALNSGLRETDFIARYGGEEFIMLFPETTLEELKTPLTNLRSKINNITFKFREQSVPVTLSFGATELKNDDNGRSAFDRADEALYEAKRAGRDTIIFKP